MSLMQYGAGDWELLRIKAGLHKSIPQIEEYFEFLVEQCKQMVEVKPIETKKEGEEESKEIEGKEEGEDNEKEEDEDVMEIDDKEEDEKMEDKKPEIKKEKKQDEAKTIVAATAVKNGIISCKNLMKNHFLTLFVATMARKLLKRLKLLDDIKNKVLKHPELETLLNKSRSGDMPSW